MKRLVLLVTLTAAGIGSAAPPQFSPPAEVVPVGGYAIVDVTDASVASVVYVGLSGDKANPLPGLMLKDGRDFILPTGGLPAGKYRFAAVASSKTGEQTRADFSVTVGTPGPTPDPPPDPTPDPTPDDGPNPFPGVSGLHVLFVIETADPVPQSQFSILYGKEVRGWLDANCVKGPTGTAQYRIYDKDSDTTQDQKVWKDGMSRPRTGVPWVVIGNGKTGYEGPLPANPEEFLKLVKKYTKTPVGFTLPEPDWKPTPAAADYPVLYTPPYRLGSVQACPTGTCPLPIR